MILTPEQPAPPDRKKGEIMAKIVKTPVCDLFDNGALRCSRTCLCRGLLTV